MLLLLVGTVIALLPTLIAKTALRNFVVAAVLPANDVRVSIGEASLGWFSEPALSQVELRDAADQPLVKVESVRVGRTPLALAMNRNDLGEIDVTRPTVYLTVRPDGSNFEDAFGEVMADVRKEVGARSGDPRTTRPVAVQLNVVDATMFVHDTATDEQWRASGLNLQYDSREGVSGIGAFSASGQLEARAPGGDGAIPAGRFSVSLEAAENGRQQFQGSIEAVALAAVRPWLERSVAGVEVSGTLSGEATASWEVTTAGAKPQVADPPWRADTQLLPAGFTSSGSLRIDRLDVAAPVLKGDRLRLATISMPWQMAAQPHGIAIDELRLQSDVCQLEARGAIDSEQIVAGRANGGDLQVRGAIDLAKLAAMLPRALRIRGDTQVTSGMLELTARSRLVDGSQTLTGTVRTADLAATTRGRPIRWDQPLSATFDLRRDADALRIESLACDSDFLKVRVSGTPQQLTTDAEFDLNRLAAELGQFIDLTGVELAGSGAGHVELSRAAGDESSGVDIRGAKLSIADLRVAINGWRIAEPRVELSGDGHWNGATGEIASPSAELVTSTVALRTQGIRMRIGGEGPPQASGSAAFRANLVRMAAWQSGANATPEYRPQGEIIGSVRFSQQADRITGELKAGGENLSLAQWSNGGSAGSYQTIWQEPRLNVLGTVAYEPRVDRLTFQKFDVQSNTLQANVSGGAEKVTTAADVNIHGTVNYDLAQVSALLRPYLGGGVQLVGREAARFQVAGTLGEDAGVKLQNVRLRAEIHWSRRVRAQFEAPWSSANLYGLPIGSGKIAATLSDGMIQVQPLALDVAEGRLTAAPAIRLDPAPSELTLSQGPLLSGVRISPEVSNAMLKYIAPVLAGATRSEGKFSLDLEGARVPLDTPKQTDAAGQLAVHSVQVVPGPMVVEWIGLAQQIEGIAKRRDPTTLAHRPNVTLLAIQDQNVNFRVFDRRVHHQSMEFQIDDLTLRSSGSVGLDETLDLVIQVPIPDRWIGNDRLLGGLKGQTIDIGVTGTLSRPRMDQSAIAGLSQQLIQSAAQGKVGEEVNRVLDKIFRSR